MPRTGHAGGRRSLRYSLVTVAGFRFALVLENGEFADRPARTSEKRLGPPICGLAGRAALPVSDSDERECRTGVVARAVCGQRDLRRVRGVEDERRRPDEVPRRDHADGLVGDLDERVSSRKRLGVQLFS
jgi:hypothetical protein